MPALVTPTHVALHVITVKQLMATATVVQTAMFSTTVVKMLTVLNVNYTLYHAMIHPLILLHV